jgi:hypothetical protein
VGIVAEGEGLELDTGASEAAVLQFDQSELLAASLGAEMFEISEFRPETPEVPLTESVLEVDALTLIAGAAGSQSDAMKTQDNVFPGGGGALQGGTASFFGLEARGTKFVYVVDYSGSMTGPKLYAAKAELIRSLRGLSSKVEFFIIFYDNHFVPMPGGKLIHATEANKQKAIAWVEQIYGGGGTDPTWAMELALSLKPDAVWLLSDGKFALRACEVIREANAASNVQIHTIAFHDNIGERQLRLIAQENGGRFRFVPGPTRRYGPRRHR